MTFFYHQLIALIVAFLAFRGSYGIRHGEVRRNMMGGWSSGDINDERVKDCTLFAFSELLGDKKYDFLVDINESEYSPKLVVVGQQKFNEYYVLKPVKPVQVVAGMNYKLQFEVINKESEECVGGVGVILYRRFSGEISITSWLDEFPCGSI